MPNHAEQQQPSSRGWAVKLLPCSTGGHVSVVMHESLGWAIVQLDDSKGWGAVHADTGEVVHDAHGRLREWQTMPDAMRALEQLCPDCYGSVGEIMKRLAPCATCNGTERI